MNELLQLALIVIVALLFMQIHFHKKYFVDKLRQDLFRIRDELFQYAARGGIAFDHPAYTMARTYLNGSIRYAERLSLIKFSVSGFVLGRHKSIFIADIENRLKGISPDQRSRIDSALNEATALTIFYIVDKNVVTFLLSRFLRTINKAKSIFKLTKVRDLLSKQYEEQYIDAIYSEGSIDQHKVA